MRQMIAALTVTGLLALAPSVAWAQSPQTAIDQLEELMVQNADTPAEHQALAGYYRAKAEEAKAVAEHHRAMARTYAGGKLTQRQAMKKHCSQIVELNEKLAAQYEDLAKEEEAAAKM